jgi:DNA polymerase-3 subunit delta'
VPSAGLPPPVSALRDHLAVLPVCQQAQALLIAVNFLGFKGPLVLPEVEGAGVPWNDFSVEAGTPAGVAGTRSLLIDIHEENVLIAVGANFLHFLDMPRSGALVPDFLSTAGIVDGFADPESLFEGFLIHPGEHEGFLGGGIEGEGGDEPIRVEFRAEGCSFVDGRLIFPGGKTDGFLIAHGREAGGVKGKSKARNGENLRAVLIAARQRIRWIRAMAVTAARALELMEGAHQRERLAHAFLISGPAGSGKRELAARVIKMVNPPTDDGGSDLFGAPEEGPPPPDLDSLQGEFVRIVRPRSKSRRILIGEIRELERSIYLAAPREVWKVGVIVDADRMFDQPANAFLKTLEEPPPRCLLLLLTAHAEILLPTIRSRCVNIVLQPTERYEVLGESERKAFAGILAQGAQKPSAHRALLLKASFEALLAARKSAIKSANDAAQKEEQDTYKQATEGDWLDEREEFYAAKSASEYLAVRSALVDWLISWLGDAIRQKVGVSELGFAEYAAETAKFAESQDLNALLKRIDTVQELRDLLNTNVPEGLAIEVSFLKAFGG